VAALTIGITSAGLPACKRGVAVNLAAVRARDTAGRERVCVVDADPRLLDVTTRLAVSGPRLEDFLDADVRTASIAEVHEPPLWVLPSSGAGVASAYKATAQALPRLRADFDVVVCDLVVGPSGPTRVAGRLEQLDWLLIAVTPDVEPVEAAARFLEHFDDARARGEITKSVQVGIVTTGDEGTTGLPPEVVGNALGRPVVGSIRQLWGRSAPNLGFGAALGITELDDAVGALFERIASRTALNPATSRAS
jgi:cellulose biosynthesis protein BcsQ